jgi:hypothetical protein
MISRSLLQRGHRETSMAKTRFKSLAQLPDETLLFVDFSVPSGLSDTLPLRLPGTRMTSSRRLKFGELSDEMKVSPLLYLKLESLAKLSEQSVKELVEDIVNLVLSKIPAYYQALENQIATAA